MKRSLRLSILARHSAWQSAAVLMVSVAIVCWVPMAVLSGEQLPGGSMLAVAMGILALVGMGIAAELALEAIRLSRLSKSERRWESERAIRPRI